MGLFAVFFGQVTLDVSIFVDGASLVDELFAKALFQRFARPFAPIDDEEDFARPLEPPPGPLSCLIAQDKLRGSRLLSPKSQVHASCHRYRSKVLQ